VHAHGTAAERDRALERRLDLRARGVGAEDRVLDPRGQLAAVYFFFSL
jgi:hypothetical protein